MKKYSLIILVTLIATPIIAFAVDDLSGLMTLLTDLIKQATLVVAALALLFFFWGLASFILHASDETKRKENKSIMLWGIIALFVMVSVWGIVEVLGNTFLDGGGSPSPIHNTPNQNPSPFI